MQNELYRISDVQQEGNQLTCRVAYDATHPIFAGHFPQQPVVPGVCTMAMIKDLLEQALGKKLLLRSTGQVKFLRLILPDVTPVAAISWQETDKGYSVTAGLKDEGVDLFKMNAVFEAIAAHP